MDPALAIAVPLGVGADRAADRRLCRPAFLRLRARRAAGPAPQHGRADLARHPARDRHEPLSDHARQRAGLFRRRRLAAVLPAGRPLPRRDLRVRARGEAQNLLSLQSGIATIIEPGGAQRPSARRMRFVRAICCWSRPASGSPPTAWCWKGSGTGRSKPDHRRDGAAHRARGAGDLCRHAQPDAAAQIEVRAADSATLLAEIGRLMLAAEQGKARYRRLADRAAAI